MLFSKDVGIGEKRHGYGGRAGMLARVMGKGEGGR